MKGYSMQGVKGKSGRKKKDTSKTKEVYFRFEESELEKLENIAQAQGAGTANMLMRELAYQVINTAGAVSYGKEKNEV
jgi:hypothetical protein